ncbi:hypothetical protein Thimo_0949 [Thioflavicoccus mobilis 8321]|uniref:Uncharacterized protein n=1 Tax=Thioflavicoccus mobilis 8321 TaxID=765912 RepID=L0GVB9_9GAMM|nr:hypothetical protein [Thioflavicoccus mobilis]AGA89777.1 hypothetical protein Thimo_0949 [Thioflavicoccus mobilis 8321]
MTASPDVLRRLAGLLAQPADDALDLLRDWLPAAPWLAQAIAELAALPLAEWQGEHTRLFINGYPKTPCWSAPPTWPRRPTGRPATCWRPCGMTA